MKDQQGIGDVDYTIKLNKQNVKYNEVLNFKPQGDNSHITYNNHLKFCVPQYQANTVINA